MAVQYSSLARSDLWRELLKSKVEDTGWVNLTLINGWVSVQTPQVRRIKNIVYLRGILDSTAATNNIFANVTNELMKADVSHSFVVNNFTAAARSPSMRLFVATNGDLSVGGWVAGDDPCISSCYTTASFTLPVSPVETVYYDAQTR